MIKYIKSVLWRVAKRLSYIEDALCLKVKVTVVSFYGKKKVRERNVTLTIWSIYKHETVVSPTADLTHKTQTLTLLSYQSARWPQPLKAVTTNAAIFARDSKPHSHLV